MAKSPKEKVVHKAMKSIDKLYNEVPGKCYTCHKIVTHSINLS